MQGKCKKLREKIVNSFVSQLRESQFYQIDFNYALDRCLSELGNRKINQIICYGLGSFHDGVEITSRYQLALLYLLFHQLKDKGCPLESVIEIYDPSFDQVDKDTLLSFNNPSFKLIEKNEYCARRLTQSNLDRCSLFYMPHLDKYLYNNLLGVNWSQDNLSRLVILGNSFQEMIDGESRIKCRSELHYLNRLVANFEEDHKNTQHSRKRKGKPVDTNRDKQESAKALVEMSIVDQKFDHPNIFNSLSFHVLNEDWLAANPSKLLGSYLPNWSCVVSCSVDDWANDDQSN